MRYRSLFPFLACAVVLTCVSSVGATTTNIGKPYNVLDGSIVASSSSISLGFPPTHAVDDLVRFCCPADQDHGAIFNSFDPDQRLGMTGNYGVMRKLRIWTIPIVADERIPNSVTVRSSLNTLSGAALITASNYETALGTFPLGIGAFTGTAPGTDSTFATVAINAPAGTQSLYLSFGAGDFKAERISEVQAFIPEPSAILLVGFASLSIACVRRRRTA
jgi:hypothetical protein